MLRGERKRGELKELEVARQRAHLAVKLVIDLVRPFVVDAGLGIENGSIALANDGERLKHVVENDSGGQRSCQLAANCVEATVDSDRRVEEGLGFANPLLVAPVKGADGGRGGIVAVLAESEFAGHAADCRIGEVADELLDCAGGDLRADVHEEDDVCGGLGDAGAESGRLAGVHGQRDCFQARVLPAGKEFGRAVG